MKKFTHLLLLGMFGLWFALQANPAHAQGGRLIAETELKDYDKLPSVYLHNLWKGVEKIGDKQKKEIALIAKYYVLYQTIPERQKDGNVVLRRQEFKDRIEHYYVRDLHRPNNQEFRDLMTKELVKCFRMVFAKNQFGLLENDIPSCVNAGLMLPELGKIDSIEVLDLLTDLIQDSGKPAAAWGSALTGLGRTPMGPGFLMATSTLAPGKAYGKEDAVKLFAFKGLQEAYRKPVKESDLGFAATGFLNDAKRKKLAERLNPMINYILVPPHLASQAEADGFRYIRCEAIKALARIPVPYVPESPDPKTLKKGKILAPVAYALLRVLAEGPDAVWPPATPAEKYEAALGLCQINGSAKLEEEKLGEPNRYNNDMAVALVGQFLVRFVEEYQADRAKFLSAEKLPPRMAWKVVSRYLAKAVEEFPNRLPAGSKARQNAEGYYGAIQPSLQQMTEHKAAETPSQLMALVRNLSNPDPAVYQGTEYKINLRWPPF
jgi:hypothetical protein